MIRASFAKMSGAGNDFVLIDRSLRNFSRPGSALATRLCSRRHSIGADGLLIVRRGAPGGLPAVDYYNADGSKAFCANGTRCAAWWMHAHGWVGKRLTLKTLCGHVDAEVAGREKIRLRMPLPRNIRWNLRLSAAGRAWVLHAIEVGVPHAVVMLAAKDLEGFPVVAIGRALRNHLSFRPRGTNVNFMLPPQARSDRKVLRIRTYERGVEDETLACGTGALACAFCAHFLHGRPSPIRVVTQGGDILTADFKMAQGRLKEAWLEGPARITFQGEVTL